jgi:hypothetical protein
MPSSLTLIAPGIAASLAQAIADSAARWPQLARLAGQGRVFPVALQGASASDLRSWQQGLLAALGLSHAAGQYPSAAVTRTGDVREPAPGFWMHAVPMHFAAGLDHLTALMLEGDSAVTETERAELELVIREHLAAASCELVRTSRAHWLVHLPRVIDVSFVEPARATRAPLEEMLPRGRDAPELRRLMTELQMILHEHPVNARRLSRGTPAVNAIWFHGGGSLGHVPSHALPPAFGDDLYLRGIYRLHDAPLATCPDDARDLLARLSAPQTVAVVDCRDLDTLESRWIGPIARALRAGTLAHIELVLDRWRLVIQRRSLIRFWKTPRPPAQWAAL